MSRINLAMSRIRKAKDILIEAKDNFDQKYYGLSVNRSYYAMFTSARAILALKEMDSSRHSGVITHSTSILSKKDVSPRRLVNFYQRINTY